MTSEAKIITGIGIATVLIVIIGLFFAGQANPGKVIIKPEILVRANNPRVTGKDAKIQIVEFGDLECPACALLAPNMKRILDVYGDHIDFVFRVIPIHDYSIPAASVAFLGAEQGKFLNVYEIVSANLEQWSARTADKPTLFKKYAKEAGLNMDIYEKTLKEKADTYARIVKQDAEDAKTMNILATPTLIINGRIVLRGSQSFEKLSEIIQSELQSSTATGTATTTQ